MNHPKRIGFLTFGHWQNHPASHTRSAADSLHQTLDLAVAAEELGMDGAFLRVHHFARQLASPIPLLSAIAARTTHLEMGTGVIDMRYENPMYLAEEAAATDLISNGRLQLGISRGSPGVAYEGPKSFGYDITDGQAAGPAAQEKALAFLRAIEGHPVAHTAFDANGQQYGLRIQPQSEGLRSRIWWGSGTRASAEWVAEQGMNLMSSTLLVEDTGEPFDQLQLEQINRFRAKWDEMGWDWTPRVSVSRSVIPVTTAYDQQLFGRESGIDQVGVLEGVLARFGKNYVGPPDELAIMLAEDAAVQAADTLIITIPNQLGVDYNTRLIETVLTEVAPAIGWQRNF